MYISAILRPAAVRTMHSLSSKKRLFHDLGDIAATVYGLPLDATIEALMERETLGPTGVGQGIALPHARLKDLNSVVGVFMRIEKPLDFNSVDRQPVDLVFGLFAPANSGVDHLKALALVARTLRNPLICSKLRSNEDPATLHAVLTEGPTSVAA